MDDTNDIELLGRYTREGSEEAFSALVARYVNLVYSVALRRLGNPHQAEEITQAVFVLLARKARHMTPSTLLAGWLHRTAWFTADNALKIELRRQRREQEAYVQSHLNEAEPDVWAQVSPFLDQAMAELNEADRHAIVLRFFDGRRLGEVGAALGLNEEAAKKRVNRAVEKLRAHFARRGIAVSASMIVAAIAANAVQAAPAHLASGLAAASWAAAAAGAPGLTSGLLGALLAKAPVKLALVTLAAILGLVATRLFWSAGVTRESLRRGLVLHLTLDRPEAGAQVSDSSRKGNHGRVTGARWTANGRRGGAYEFTTNGDQIQVPAHPSLPPRRLTVAAWIKTSAIDGTWRRIFYQSFSEGYALSIAGDRKDDSWRGRLCLETYDGFCLSQNVVADGQWHHVVAVYDTTGQWLYVDGRRQSGEGYFKAREPRPTDTYALIIGGDQSPPTNPAAAVSFQGLIDEPMVFDRILSPEAVALLYADTKAR